jgi:hypothetical protein
MSGISWRHVRGRAKCRKAELLPRGHAFVCWQWLKAYSFFHELPF